MSSTLSPGRTIALFCNPEYQALREKVSGVYSAATKYGWQVFQVERSPTPAAIAKVKRMLDPLGFIIDPLQLTHAIGREAFSETPVVLLGQDSNRAEQIFDCSCQDARQPVHAAVQVLCRREDLACLAYVGHPSRASWSRDRGDLFRAHATDGRPCFEYEGPSSESGKGCRQLVDWLRALPKPAGLFLATDHLAPSVFNAIQKAGIAVPDAMAVISVDDIHQICLNVSPNLTSVNVNFFHAGENAVELLKRRILDPGRPVEKLVYGVVTVSKRASTRKPYTDRRVTKAVEFIANNITAKISSRHVIREMGCGRRQGEDLFRRHAGSSILRAIQTCRVEKAMTLLRNGALPIEQVPAFCGYDSPAFFKTVFRRETGMTMREWRKRQAETP